MRLLPVAILSVLPALAAIAAPVTLTLKAFPVACTLTIDGVPAKALATRGAVRTYAIEKGWYIFALSAPGYLSREIIRGISAETLIEVKLERADSGLARIADMATGRQPKCVEYTPDGRFILSALLDGPGIDVFDAATFAKVATLSPPDPWPKSVGFVEIAFLPGRGELWVSQMSTGMIHAFRLDDLAYVDSFKAGGSWPKVIAIGPDETSAYVSNWESHTVSVIDTATRTVRARIATGGIPRGLAFSRDGRFLYVCRYEPGALLKVDLATNAVVKTIEVGPSALRHVMRHPTRDVLYVSDLLSGRVYALDATSDTVIASAFVDQCLNTLKVSPDGGSVFVSSRGPNDPVNWMTKGPAFGRIYRLDPLTLEVVDWAWGGNQPTGLAISGDGGVVCFSDFLDARLEAYAVAPAGTPVP